MNEKRKEVEKMIAGPDVGFSKAVFFDEFISELLYPYPTLAPDKQAAADEMAAKVRAYADAHIDHMKIDRDARIPDSVIQGLADIGMYKLTIPTEYGGLGFGQQQYLKTMEIL